MAAPIRIPLAVDIEPRLAGTDKDSVASNIFYDKQLDGKVFATKRPGIASYLTGSGQAKGIFNYGGQTFVYTGPYYFGFSPFGYGTNFLANLQYPTDYGIGFSSSGLVWSIPQTTPVGASGYFASIGSRVIFGNDGGTSGLYSDNGLNWSSMTLPSPLTSTIKARGGDQFIIYQTSGNFSTSPNGITWTSHFDTDFRNVTDFTYGNGRWVAIRDNSDTTRIAYSSDGISWTNQAILGSPTGPLQIKYKAGVFLYVSSGSSTAYYTTNPVSWSSTTLPTSTPFSLAANGNYFFLYSEVDYRLWRSSDATNWTNVTLPARPTNAISGRLATNSQNELLIVFDLSGVTFTSSNDGTTWLLGSLPAIPDYIPVVV